MLLRNGLFHFCQKSNSDCAAKVQRPLRNNQRDDAMNFFNVAKMQKMTTTNLGLGYDPTFPRPHSAAIKLKKKCNLKCVFMVAQLPQRLKSTLKKISKMLILAFEANSAMSCQNGNFSAL